MFDSVVITTDGSESAQRAVETAIDIAERFEAAVYALYVVDETEVEESPGEVRADVEQAIEQAGEDAIEYVETAAGNGIETAIRRGEPAEEIIAYADEVDADVIATGTRGRHGDHAFLLGSVAEAVVRRASQPVLTVRQLDDTE
jgi:nucleotide-binding universal stress UspA family protein